MSHVARHGRRNWLLPGSAVALAVILVALVVGVTSQSSPQPDAPDAANVAATTAATDEAANTSESKAIADVLAGRTVLREGDQGLAVRSLQQRLVSAGLLTEVTDTYDAATTAAVDRLQEKFELTRTGMVNRYSMETLLRITARGPDLPADCKSGLVVCVDKTAKVVRLVDNGVVVSTLDARFGTFGTNTREGTFAVTSKIADDYSTLFGVPMKYSMYFSGGQAIHYSEYFERDGYAGASAGCINTRDLAATAKLFNAVPVGTPVVVYQ